MSSASDSVESRLNGIVAEFSDLEPRERLELLLEYADNLQPLPPDLQARRDAGEHRVHECQTPVFLWVFADEGGVRIECEVAPEAPTVKGFVSILVETFSGASPAEILAVPPNVIQRLGLVEALGMVRMRGLSAILHRIREEVRKAETGGRP